ncbi:MAG: DUF4320 family protein [Hydrogenoanaerobacterium sp.]
MKKVLLKLHSKLASSELVVGIIVLIFFTLAAAGGLTMWGQQTKLDDLQQMAQVMAREIALEGRTDGVVTERLGELEQLMNMDVTMDVDGTFVRGTSKLLLQSDFTVSLSYKTQYGVGWLGWRREKTYVKQAVGTAEEYHK